MSTRELARGVLPARAGAAARGAAGGRQRRDAGDAPTTDRWRPRSRRRRGTASRETALVLAELTQQKLLRAVYSERQLEEVMVDFWFNHFNVFAGKGQTRIYVTEYERDAIRPHVFGKFRDLLGAVAREPGDAVLPGQLAERRAGRGADHDAGTRAGVPGQRAAGAPEQPARPAEPSPRDQRELRARADGAAHARRRRRLHAEGRPGDRARVHRLDDRHSRGRAAASGSSRACTTTARRSCSA